MAQADLRIPQLASLVGYSQSHVVQLGRRVPVPRHIQVIVKAWYLMDGPMRQRLMREIEEVRESA